MNVYMFGYSKKKNSTAKPLLNTGTLFAVQLKEETSVLNPVLIFNPNSTGMPNPFTPAAFTYAYIPTFSRYYFLVDWRYLNGLWECSLTVDVLASFKTAIGATSAYVERSSSMYDSNIMDIYYPVKDDCTVTVQDFGQIFNINTGCYVVGIINCQATNYRVGSVTYYAMTPAELSSFLQYIYSGSIYNMETVTDVSEGLYKAISDPGKYIVSCMWVPFLQNIIGSGVPTNIVCGYYSTPANSQIMTGITLSAENRVSFNNHPQISRGAYLNFAPFSKYTLYFPPFGAIPVDPIFRTQGSYLNTEVAVDLISGMANLRVSVQSVATDTPFNQHKILAERSAMVGVPIQLSQVGADFLSGIATVAGAALAGAASGGVGAITGLASGVSSMSNSVRIQSTGYNGSFLETQDATLLVSEFYTVCDADNADHGKPLMSTKTLSTLSGYIKCSDGHFDGSCTDQERNMINQFMVDGFYME